MSDSQTHLRKAASGFSSLNEQVHLMVEESVVNKVASIDIQEEMLLSVLV